MKIENNFLLIFHGYYIPLQGVEYIIKAAKILEIYSDIKFRLIGSGQTYKENFELAKKLELNNTEFISRVSYENLPKCLASADCCLGIFGDTDKTQRVIPNKVYEAIAMAKPVISADTPAIRELFTDRENILLCRAANSNSLADKILELKKDYELRNKIAKQGYELFKQYCRPKLIVQKLV